MHVIFRESHGLEETATPTDLAQSPADLVALSFSDSDLGAFAAGWRRAEGKLPTLRLANLAALGHPLSVDTYVEQTLAGASAILIRLIGGVPYWEYGVRAVADLARREKIALAVLPADGRPDPRLDELSTIPVSTLRRLQNYCDAGGAVAAQAALAQLALAGGLYAGPVQGAKTLPMVGAWTPAHGVTCPLLARDLLVTRPPVVVSFYRAYLAAADLAPIEALFTALEQRGFAPIGLFAPSLKAPDAAGWLARQIRAIAPAAVVNATAFSGKGESGASPLDAAGAPVFQVALATSDEKLWREEERGLSPADLAMHVVLPEVDGRIFAGVASFKAPEPRDEALQFARMAHRPCAERIEAVADKVKAWTDLGARPMAEKKTAIVLSTYPGKDWRMAHAVGLDALASADAILEDIRGETDVSARPSRGGDPVLRPNRPPLASANALTAAQAQASEVSEDSAASLADALRRERISWPLDAYREALAVLPASLRETLGAVWDDPSADPHVEDGAFQFPATRRDGQIVALQPERGCAETRADDYHDLARTPRHAYVAFYLWLRHQEQIDALIHVGAHGTLEWLPGKAVALCDECWPEALIGPTPVIYPFIVNDPGEAAQAKRRIGAVTLGHMPPPLEAATTPDRFARLEAVLDEFSNADGLDPRRRDRLMADIRDEAQALGVEADLGLDEAASAAEAITRIDRFVCDVKESQFGDGLHIWGRPPVTTSAFDAEAAARAERTALIAALNGARIEAGPSGSPYRGRTDVLPTGRNLYTTDPRAVPTRSAHAEGVKLAEELVRRHLQDEGDYPTGLIVDLWGSATMRTAGEEFAMALHLLGVAPKWDEGSERVSGFEILPLALLDRPRIDVTLRVSGLFRDVFPTLSTLFAEAVRALAARDETAEWNPFVRGAGNRVFGPAPGAYGLGMGGAIEDYSEAGRRAAGEAWLAASAYALDRGVAERDEAGIADRVRLADAFVHPQDLPETDLLLAMDYASHEAGFAAAQGVTGGAAALYHLDNTRPGDPRARTLREEIARTVRARAANPRWIAGMMRHSHAGAAEIAATLDHMGAFAHLAGVVAPHLFDAYHDATLGDGAVAAFMAEANPEALRAMRDRFAALRDAGLWTTRSNSIAMGVEAAE